uniref:Major capsid protein n=1 Tax=Panagrolaimus superbus TaxID=310955 RepID=A0A914Y6K7_9BILA
MSLPCTLRTLFTDIETRVKRDEGDAYIALNEMSRINFDSWNHARNIWGRTFLYASGQTDIRFNRTASDHFYHADGFNVTGAPWEATSNSNINGNGYIKVDRGETSTYEVLVQGVQVVTSGVCSPDAMFCSMNGVPESRLCDIFHRSQFEPHTVFAPVTTTGVLDVLNNLPEGSLFIPGVITLSPSVQHFISPSNAGAFDRTTYTTNTCSIADRGLYDGGSLVKLNTLLLLCAGEPANDDTPHMSIYRIATSDADMIERGGQVDMLFLHDPNIPWILREGGYVTWSNNQIRKFEYIGILNYLNQPEYYAHPLVRLLGSHYTDPARLTVTQRGVYVPYQHGTVAVIPSTVAAEGLAATFGGVTRKRRNPGNA